MAKAKHWTQVNLRQWKPTTVFKRWALPPCPTVKTQTQSHQTAANDPLSVTESGESQDVHTHLSPARNLGPNIEHYETPSWPDRKPQNVDNCAKFYILHAPEVKCISKLKTTYLYDSGLKVRLDISLKGNMLMVAKSFPSNTYNGAFDARADQANRQITALSAAISTHQMRMRCTRCIGLLATTSSWQLRMIVKKGLCL